MQPSHLNPYHIQHNLPKSMFRRYDIRGKIGIELNENAYYTLGLALGAYAKTKHETTVIVGRDGRNESPVFAKALISGLNAAGIDVVDIGLVPTPVLYFATHHLPFCSGLMVTGSHNPKDYNGLKMVIKGQTLASGEIQQIAKLCETNLEASLSGSYKSQDITEDYIAYICKDIKLQSPPSIVLDAGNGAGGDVAVRLFKRLGCKVDALHCDIDGNFPNHHPDPSVEENLEPLIQRVKETSADGGLALDGDADRIGIVTNKGEIVWPDMQMMFYAMSVLTSHPSSPIVFDVKCSRHLGEWIKNHNGNPQMWQTGHSVLKARMLELQAPLAGELSGHIFFNDDRWFGFDDGLYAGARWLEIMDQQPGTPSEAIAHLPKSFSTPELKVPLDEQDKQPVMDALQKHAFPGALEVITLDGVRVEYSHGWALIRMSHTTPCLTVRFEADSLAMLEQMKSDYEALINRMLPVPTASF